MGIVWGLIILGRNCLQGIAQGANVLDGNCLGGNCPGSSCPGIVLEAVWIPKWGTKCPIVTRFSDFVHNCCSFQQSSKIIYYLLWYKKDKRQLWLPWAFVWVICQWNSNLEDISWSDETNLEFKAVSHLLKIMLLCNCKAALGTKFSRKVVSTTARNCFSNYSQTCSNNHIFKMTTYLRRPMLNLLEQIPIQSLLYKTTTCLKQPATTFFVSQIKKNCLKQPVQNFTQRRNGNKHTATMDKKKHLSDFIYSSAT